MEVVLLEKHGYTATITLNRPKRGNALTPEMQNLLARLLDEVSRDEDIACLILTGAGKYFCTGMDLGASNQRKMSEGLGREDAPAASPSIFETLRQFPKPVIARVNGPVIGGGNGLVWCCDFRISIDTAYFWFSEVTRGLVPALISAYIMPQLGSFKSKQYMILGKRMPASVVLADGQLTSVVSSMVELDAAVQDLVESLGKCAPGALADTKAAIHCYEGQPHPHNVAYSKKLFVKMMTSKEAAYGLQKFAMKQKPDWRSKL